MGILNRISYVPCYDDMIIDRSRVRSDSLLTINDKPVPDETGDLIHEWINIFLESSVCPFCNIKFEILLYDDHQKEMALVSRCMNCGHWICSYSPDDDCEYDGDFIPYKARLGKLRSFETVIPNGCASELACHFRRDEKKFHSLPPKALEKFVADVFKANYADAEVIHVGQPNDGGVDVLFTDTSKQQWLIQVKRRQDSKTEGVSTIRNLLGAMFLKRSLTGIVVSTADHFSYRVLEAVGRAKELGHEIELIDKGILNRMCLPLLFLDRPWLSFFQDYPSILEWFDSRIPNPRQLIFDFRAD